MKTISETEIDKLIGDIKSIKTVISRNRPLIQQVMLPVNFRLISFLIGISVIVFSIVFYYLIERYGGYGQIPDATRSILWFILIADYIALGAMKRYFWLRSMRRYGRDITFSQVIKEMYSIQAYHVWIPLVLTTLFLSIYLVLRGYAYYVVPTISIGFGIGYNFLGALTSIRHYLITGYWLMITGVGIIAYPELSVVIALIVSLGFGMLLFAIISTPPADLPVEEE